MSEKWCPAGKIECEHYRDGSCYIGWHDEIVLNMKQCRWPSRQQPVEAESDYFKRMRMDLETIHMNPPSAPALLAAGALVVLMDINNHGINESLGAVKLAMTKWKNDPSKWSINHLYDMIITDIEALKK